MIENKKDFIRIQDFSKESLLEIIELAIDMKLNKSKYYNVLQNKKLGMIFQKSSTRTRVSFECGIYELGGTGLFLNSNDIQLGRGETIEDTARVLSRYLDAIMIRTFKQSDVETLAEFASIPIINGLTDLLHPCQIIADFQTILEKKGRVSGLKIAFIGDGNNVANSLGVMCSKLGTDFAIANPKGYDMPNLVKDWIKNNSLISGSNITYTNDPKIAVENADVIYTDVWTSMGQEKENEIRKNAFKGFEVNSSLVDKAKKDYIFLHCLPAHRGEEVSTDIIDGPHSVIFDEAENRLHAQKAIMYLLMK